MGGFLFGGIAIALVGLTFLPFVLRIDLVFDFQSNKLGCNISLYGILKIFGGYISPGQNGIAFHVSDKKAFVFSFRQMGQEQKGLAQRHGFRLKKAVAVTELNLEGFFPFYTIVETGKLLLLFQRHSPYFESKTVLVNEENIRVFARLTFLTFLVKELIVNLKYLILKGVNALWQKKKSAT